MIQVPLFCVNPKKKKKKKRLIDHLWHLPAAVDCCTLCMGSGESIDHLFLLCSMTMELWHKPFRLANLVWVPPRSVCNMLIISFKGLGSMNRVKVLWQIACLTLIWMVWWEGNARIFEDKWGTIKMLWDLVYFYSTFWASTTIAFKGIPLSLI